MKCILSIILIIVTFCSRAEEIFPVGCNALVVHEEAMTLVTEKPTVVMIHNLSTIDIWITHPVSDPSASAGWSSRLQAGNWSALALDSKSFELSCIESRPGHEQQIPCAGVLAACQWPTATVPKGETSTYWAGEDMPLSALTAHIGSRGFKLPALAQ